MRLGSAFAWLLALLLGSLAGVRVYTSTRVPQPSEVRPITVWQDSRVGDHVASSENKLEGGVSELRRGAETRRDNGEGGGAPDRIGGGGAPAGDDDGSGGGGTPRDDGRGAGNTMDADPVEHVADLRDLADDSGAGGAAPTPDDALEPDEDQGRGGDNDDSRDGDGGGGD